MSTESKAEAGFGTVGVWVGGTCAWEWERNAGDAFKTPATAKALTGSRGTVASKVRSTLSPESPSGALKSTPRVHPSKSPTKRTCSEAHGARTNPVLHAVLLDPWTCVTSSTYGMPLMSQWPCMCELSTCS